MQVVQGLDSDQKPLPLREEAEYSIAQCQYAIPAFIRMVTRIITGDGRRRNPSGHGQLARIPRVPHRPSPNGGYLSVARLIALAILPDYLASPIGTRPSARPSGFLSKGRCGHSWKRR
jgi:hypothetical protein